MRRRRGPPTLASLLRKAVNQERKPAAFVLAGHNGSGKSTLWYQRLASQLQVPLINADRLTASILPSADPGTRRLPTWAQQLRDDDERWQRLSQEGVRAFVGHAAPLADMTLMFDNSRASEKAFALVRAQQKNRILFDCRDPRYSIKSELRAISGIWLDKVVGPFESTDRNSQRTKVRRRRR